MLCIQKKLGSLIITAFLVNAFACGTPNNSITSSVKTDVSVANKIVPKKATTILLENSKNKDEKTGIALVTLRIKQKTFSAKAYGDLATKYRITIKNLTDTSIPDIIATKVAGSKIVIGLPTGSSYYIQGDALNEDEKIISRAIINSLNVVSEQDIIADLEFEPFTDTPKETPVKETPVIELDGVRDLNVPIPKATPYIKDFSLPTSTPFNLSITSFGPADAVLGNTIISDVTTNDETKLSSLKILAVIESSKANTKTEVNATYINNQVSFVLPDDLSINDDEIFNIVTKDDTNNIISSSNYFPITIFKYSDINLIENTGNTTGSASHIQQNFNFAVDKNISTIWSSPVLGSAFIESQAFSKIRYINLIRVQLPYQIFKSGDIKIETSTDGANFTVLSDKSYIFDNNTLPYGYIKLNSPTRAKYIKVTFNNMINYFNNYEHPAISEIQAFLTNSPY